MNLLQLIYFAEAAKRENLSETAKKFFVPTSNISSSIKRLEQELGCKLFNHSSNKITLNENGIVFYERISKALSLIDDAKRELSDVNEQELSGEIYLHCQSNRGAVTRAIEKFREKHPGVKFRMSFGEADANNVDVIISFDIPFEYQERTLLIDEDIPIAMHNSHPLAGKEDLTVADLRGEHFITGLSVETEKACKDAGFIPEIAIEINDPALVRKYIEMGLGIGFIPAYSWKGLFSDNIVLRSLGLRRRTYAYTPANRYTKRATRVFIETLAAVTADARIN